MTQHEVENSYFMWMYSLVCGKEDEAYYRLLNLLDSIPFTYTIDMDSNRAYDGIDLRYRFGYETNTPDSAINDFLINKKCSVLEMMVALSCRIEDDIMWDEEKGNRTGLWFFEMISSLGLLDMFDGNFDLNRSARCINNMLQHRYAFDGTGGLFTVKSTPLDFRNMEIWQQANRYLNEFLKENN